MVAEDDERNICDSLFLISCANLSPLFRNLYHATSQTSSTVKGQWESVEF